jgi:chromosomal replication initiator protein
LQNIEPRLTSRFEWGLVHGIEMSSPEEIAQILKAKAQAMNFVLHPKVAEYLLETFSSTKMVIKALEMLVLRTHMGSVKGPLSVVMAAQMVEGLLEEERKNALTPQTIVQGVAEFYGIRSEDILGKAQTRDCVLPRQISMHICRHHLKLPFVRIANLFGKDHSTVMTSVKVVQKGIDNDDQEVAGSYHTILKRLRP